MNYDKEWYDNLKKPEFQPPSWIFAPVWTLLYLLMAVSFIMVIFSPFHLGNIFAYFLFFLQLWVNISWSKVFFENHNLLGAFLLCVILTILVLFTAISFYHISKLASILLLPYLCWSTFACFLSFEIWELNSDY